MRMGDLIGFYVLQRQRKGVWCMALSLESWVFVLRMVGTRDAWASCITALLHGRLA